MANLATEILGKLKRQRDIWRMTAVISIVLNIAQLSIRAGRGR